MAGTRVAHTFRGLECMRQFIVVEWRDAPAEPLRLEPKKRDEKLSYMHNNPVTRKLVQAPGDWPRSSWKYYFQNDTSLLSTDRIL
jgi:hypothetical protein